jgi:hypothetical protein
VSAGRELRRVVELLDEPKASLSTRQRARRLIGRSGASGTPDREQFL